MNATEYKVNASAPINVTPMEGAEFILTDDCIENNSVWICRLLVATELAKSTGEARRLIQQGGVKVKGLKITDAAEQFAPESLVDTIIQVGSRRYTKVVL